MSRRYELPFNSLSTIQLTFSMCARRSFAANKFHFLKSSEVPNGYVSHFLLYCIVVVCCAIGVEGHETRRYEMRKCQSIINYSELPKYTARKRYFKRFFCSRPNEGDEM